jgi:hypothetical protein
VDIMLMPRFRAVVALGLAMSGLAACGTSSPGDQPASAKSDSFSPSTAVDAMGMPTDVWWKHRMNGGVATPIEVNGLSGTATATDRLTRVSAGGMNESGSFSMTLVLSDGTTSATSHVTATQTQARTVGPPSASTDLHLNEEEQVVGPGASIHLSLALASMYSMPVVDFGDRTDLDQLPVGHVDEATVTTTSSATVNVTGGGAPSTKSQSVTSSDHYVWTVKEQLPSMTVLGKTYQRVVRMEVLTDSTNQSTLEKKSAITTLWLAAGIGIIKQLQPPNDTLSFPVTAELVDTNLGLESPSAAGP